MSPDQNVTLPWFSALPPPPPFPPLKGSSYSICTYVFGHHEDGLGFGVRARAQLVRQQQERADDQPVRQQFSSAPAHSAHMIHHLERPLIILLFVWYKIRAGRVTRKEKERKQNVITKQTRFYSLKSRPFRPETRLRPDGRTDSGD